MMASNIDGIIQKVQQVSYIFIWNIQTEKPEQCIRLRSANS